ncbi:MAG: hypothetical protein N2235_05395 [Fischerella sp.]|nr:hypothetical protein [Fischerella sp.]
MIKSIKTLSIIFLLAVTSGCASVKEASLNVSLGDTKNTVAKAMGVPEDRQFRDHMEAWQYSNIVSIGFCEYTVIWFQNSVVNGITTYRNPSMTGCRLGMKSIRWEEAPTTSVEIRYR